MSVLTPALFGFLALIPIIVALYLIRAQRRRQEISSVMLWRNLARDMDVKTRLRKPPQSILMLLQILAVLLGTLALIDVVWGDDTPPRQLTILLLDASASMNATDVAPSRFAEAKRQVAEALARASSGDEIAIVWVGPRAELLAQGRDLNALRAALDAAQPSDGSGDLATAWRLAGGLAAARPGVPAQVVLYSDGVVNVGNLPSIPATARFAPIGRTGANQGVIDIGVRQPGGGNARPTAFVRVANFSDEPVTRGVRLLADGLVFREEVARVAARGSVEIVAEPPAGARLFTAQLVGADSLATDDRADAVIRLPASRDVLLVSAVSDSLARALRAVPELNVRVTRPDDFRESDAGAIVVFENTVPANLPNAPTLIVNPPVGSWLASGRTGRPSVAIAADSASALIAGVDLNAVEFGRALTINRPDWATVVVQGQDGPLILEGERNSWRTVIFAFDPEATNLVKQLAYPALVANTIAWLAPDPVGATRAGATVRLPALGSGTIVRPDGQAATAHAPLFADTQQAGRYQWQRPGQDAVTLFAVSTVDASESAIAPRVIPMPPPIPASALEATPSARDRSGWPFWPWLAAAALGVLVIEWWLFTTRRAQ